MIRVKICGITRLEDGLAAAEAGADAIGIVFYPQSKRYLAPDQARELISRLPPFLTVIGLFVDTPPEAINRIADDCRLDGVQLHGDEPPKGCVGLNRRAIKAVRVATAQDLALAERFPVSAVLLDSKVSGHYGGTGVAVDWQVLQGFQPRCPWILAGGLCPDNVAEALLSLSPYGVDVSSGVESAPGIKDFERMKVFMAEVRAAMARKALATGAGQAG